MRFARTLPDDSPYAPRDVLADKDARTLARELLGMSRAEFSAAFKGSPMKRAKLRGLKRNAAVMLGNAGTHEDVGVLTRALDDEEPLVREHAAWALARLGTRTEGCVTETAARAEAGPAGTGSVHRLAARRRGGDPRAR